MRALLLLIACLVFGTASAGEPNPVETLQFLNRLKVVQNYAESIYGVYLRNCRTENPSVDQIIFAHRQNDASFYKTLDTLIEKYQAKATQYAASTNTPEALDAISEERRKATKMMQESVVRDESLHRFNCIKDPASLPGVPGDLRAQIERMAASE